MDRKELVNIRKSKSVDYIVDDPLIAYLCDTTIEVFEKYPHLLKCKHIIVECTFLPVDGVTVDMKSGHIKWSQLKPWCLNNPHQHFILIHFSSRYTNETIAKFFQYQDEKPDNVTLWLTGSGC
jgi:ribonuclease Z